MGTVETQSRPAELVGGRRWTFGQAVLDERTLELHVGGEQAPLERKPLEVLLYLLHHAGEVVTKDDLADNLWAGRILTETVLTRCISLLRQALKDEDRSLIRTVHGFGYRLVADVRVDTSAATPAPPAFDFKAGDHPPLRPQWKLAERLGTGGHGEAWLARHEKTGDARVFKFALDGGSLSSLKREITLYRLLHDSLGARAAIARIFEWNLAEPPYFIEMEHVAGGNLQVWCEAQGGVSAMPLSTRLELVAQIADALAAAHSVGALHKDLKPGNVLVHMNGASPAIRLCDFGSGGVLDPQRLDDLGITRQGFTKTLGGETSATPLYVSPEVIGGQPFTVQADVYSLGVLLYQVVAGDLRKALAPGWESDITDELLREDIGLAAAGNPARRLTDAAQLAERLRSLEVRREARRDQLAAQQRAERARRAMEELRRTRVYAAALLGLTALAVAGGITAYRARNEALSATATAEAMSSFLMEDVLRLDSGLIKPSEASYEALLDHAAVEVGNRLKGQPKAAANIHWLLGRRYQEIGNYAVATQQYEQAVAMFTDFYGRAADPTLMALDRLAWIYLENGRAQDAIAISGQMRTLWESRLPSNDLTMLMVRTRLARTLLTAGDYVAAERDLRNVVAEASHAAPPTTQFKEFSKQWLGFEPPPHSAPQLVAAYADLLLAGNILEELDDSYAQAESRLRSSLAVFTSALGEESELSALASSVLALVLASAGKYEEAETLALRARTFFDKALPPRHYARAVPIMSLARVRLEQQRPNEAASMLQDVMDLCTSDARCPTRIRAEFLWELGRAYDEAGNEQAAIEALSKSLEMQENLRGPKHVLTLKMRVSLADALRRVGKLDKAEQTLSAVNHEAIAALAPYQQARADFRRSEGLLWIQTRDFDQAAAALQEASDIFEHRLGPTHWRTALVRSELAAAQRGAHH